MSIHFLTIDVDTIAACGICLTTRPMTSPLLLITGPPVQICIRNTSELNMMIKTRLWKYRTLKYIVYQVAIIAGEHIMIPLEERIL
jgi:hypothetical protein